MATSHSIRLWILGCVLGSCPPAMGTTLFVPQEHATLVDAIACAVTGDTILVAEGRYSGPGFTGMDYAGKDLVVTSVAGPAHTILDGRGVEPRAFTFHSGESPAAVLDGFTITNYEMTDSDGAGLRIQASTPTIRNCVIVGNVSWGMHLGLGGGVACKWGGSATFTDCTIASNIGSPDHAEAGGVYCVGAHIRLERCILWGNRYVDLRTGTTGVSSVTFWCCAIDTTKFVVDEGEVIFAGDQVFEDPRFCNLQPPGLFQADPLDYALWADSPCLPEFSPCGELIGPLWIGCPTSSIPRPQTNHSVLDLALGSSLILGILDCTVRLRTEQDVRMSLIGAGGQIVAQRARAHLSAGQHPLSWNLRSCEIPSGAYYLRAHAGRAITTKKVLIMR